MEEDLNGWAMRAQHLMEGGAVTEEEEEDSRSEVSKFKELVVEAKKKEFPQCALLDALICVTEEAER